ncbi:unnamed protein product [Chondrus crispus]|uniref:Uncharacterized protein n=1 Tax=Chondrus crispus TaxID=2769 RepID=R7QNS2_CHOCR|nr:unnamed protein product [Chondrus crispus]CDF39010.1 unnamed protein product [Chondrus crispus]|eukprot:XP_005718915.1 unnamed protein product [Chondrus crispus]
MKQKTRPRKQIPILCFNVRYLRQIRQSENDCCVPVGAKAILFQTKTLRAQQWSRRCVEVVCLWHADTSERDSIQHGPG